MALVETVKHPLRFQRGNPGKRRDNDAVFVGQGSKWANPFKKPDVE